LISAVAVVAIWIVALVGFAIARNSKVTAEKVAAFVHSIDLSKLTGEARRRAIARLAAMLNSLSPEERQRARFDGTAWAWMAQMTEDEKGTFIEATMPTGFKQMLNSFEQLPEEKRRRAVADSLRRLKEARDRIAAEGPGPSPGDTNQPPVLSEELQAKIRTIGLKAFYSESSAQTKAELAPVLEELQRVMESGRFFRGR
jgi:hypothetical protein